MTLEKSSYEARKHKDLQFWETFLSDEFVGYGLLGKLGKASATKEYAYADCEIRSYTLSNGQVRPLGNDVALITYMSTVDGTCDGKQLPTDSWAASVYVRDGGNWKEAFHADALTAAERAVWEAWRGHDGQSIGDLTTSEISFINIFGTFFATKAGNKWKWTFGINLPAR